LKSGEPLRHVDLVSTGRRKQKQMIFSTIMVQLDVDFPASPRLKFALDLAKQFEADLIAFAAAEAHVLVPGGDIAAEMLRQRTGEIEHRIKALKEEFLSVVGDSAKASWRGGTGNPTELLATHARAANLIVTGRPAPGVAGNYHRTVDAGTLVLSAGRPVLVAADRLAALDAKKVLVAWKDTREARRALLDAMPFLMNAREVVVATVAEGYLNPAQESATDVVRFLMKHGVKARAEVLDVGHANAAEALEETALKIGGDLIVAGAYGHSRLRELAFGGMTRSLLGRGGLNLLLSN
jgi:nucleotide-binding universal stress UspA family protein